MSLLIASNRGFERWSSDAPDPGFILAELHSNPLAGAKQVTEGTHRARTIADTLTLAAECRDIVGISRVADVTRLDTLGIPVFNSFRPKAEANNLTVTCGKGLNPDAARASAYMEAIERYCGEQNGRLGIWSTLAEMGSRARVLHPTRLVLKRDHAWSSDVELEWWPTRNLDTDEIVYVPAAAVFTPYKKPPHLIGGHSDGLAAGNCVAEAIVHGLYELVERDATAFGLTLERGVRLRPPTLPGSAIELIERAEEAGIGVAVYLLPSDTRIPVFYVIFDDRVTHDGLLINGGFGAHLDPQVALLRAITEAAQTRLSVISGSREDLPRLASRRQIGYSGIRKELATWFERTPELDFAELDDLSTASLSGDLDRTRALLAQAGLPTVLAVDLTMPGIPFSVCRAIVPGVEFFHEERGRLGPRLYRAIRAAQVRR